MLVRTPHAHTRRTPRAHHGFGAGAWSSTCGSGHRLTGRTRRGAEPLCLRTLTDATVRLAEVRVVPDHLPHVLHSEPWTTASASPTRPAPCSLPRFSRCPGDFQCFHRTRTTVGHRRLWRSGRAMIRPRSPVPAARCGGSSARPATRSTAKGGPHRHADSDRVVQTVNRLPWAVRLDGTFAETRRRQGTPAARRARLRRPGRPSGAVGMWWGWGAGGAPGVGSLARSFLGCRKVRGGGRAPAALRVRVQGLAGSRRRRMTNRLPWGTSDDGALWLGFGRMTRRRVWGVGSWSDGRALAAL